VSPTELTVGIDVTISGTECPSGHWGTASLEPTEPAIFAPGNGGLYPLEDDFIDASGNIGGGTVDASGQWTMSDPVPMVPSGPAVIEGSCMPQENGDGASTEFTYPTVPVMVTSPFQVEVRPSTTVESGATLQVYLIGGSCRGASSAQTYLYNAEKKQVAMATPITSTQQQYSLTVPSGLMPGRYQIEADCVYSRGAVYGSYTPTAITVQ
jgi:hypothetical protein